MITYKNISIIIPVGPNEDSLTLLTRDLHQIEDSAEIIIIKGQNRAQQMNEGAKLAKRDFLWFLHADTRVESRTLSVLLESISRYPDRVHYFNLKFLKGSPPWTLINELGCWIRSRILGIPFGDQGFCLSKKNFYKIGCFPEDAPYGEDHLFIWHARHCGIKLCCTQAQLQTSARRYIETGWLKLTLSHARMWLCQAWLEIIKTRIIN